MNEIMQMIENGRIAGPTSVVAGHRVFPGFIDVHTHGAVGVDVNTATAEDLLRAAAYLAQNGVTAWMPTLVPDSDDNYRRIVDSIDRLMRLQVGRPVAQAVGVHYEGVFANQKMCGALRPEYFKTYTGKEIDELPTLDTGRHMITIAPEVAGGIELIRDLNSRGWIVSIGHTRADTEVLDKALAAGARHVTHFLNAMTGIHHRELGVAGWALTRGEVGFDIIGDGIHIAPEMLAFACRTKTADKVSLISDSVALAGLEDGNYVLWGEDVSLVDGRTRNARGSIAGSASTMIDGVRLLAKLGFADNEIEKMTSRNPARLLGLDAERGSLDVGKIADIVLLSSAGEIEAVWVAGVPV